jgi:hypothetical protein
MPRAGRIPAQRLLPRLLLALALLGTALTVSAPPAAAHPHATNPPVDIVLRIKGVEVVAIVDLEKWQILSWGHRATPRIDLTASVPAPEAMRRLSERLEVALDGVVVAPVLRGYLEAPLDEENLKPRAMLSVAYVASEPPKSVRLLWKNFTGIHWETEQQVPLTIEASSGVDTTTLTKAEPEYVWRPRPPAAWRSIAAPPPPAPPSTRLPVAAIALGLLALALPFVGPLKRRTAAVRFVPSVALLCVAAVVLRLDVGRVEAPWDRELPPSEAQAKAVFVGLVKNVYLAFEAESEGKIYDLLAASVERPLLDGLYGDVYESLVMRTAGGALVRVKEFVPGEVTVKFPANGSTTQFDVDGAWTVTGAMFHQGHGHERTISYRAQATVRNDGSGWRIAAITMIEHKRTDDGKVVDLRTPAPPASPAPGAEETPPPAPSVGAGGSGGGGGTPDGPR